MPTSQTAWLRAACGEIVTLLERGLTPSGGDGDEECDQEDGSEDQERQRERSSDQDPFALGAEAHGERARVVRGHDPVRTAQDPESDQAIQHGLGDMPGPPRSYSHSIVLGGFDEMSSATRFTAGISLMIRLEIVSSRS